MHEHTERDENQGELFATSVLCTVPDEITALAIRSFLLEAGIASEIKDMSGSFYGSVLSGLQGYWGKIVVAQENQEKASKLLDTFWREFQRAS